MNRFLRFLAIVAVMLVTTFLTVSYIMPQIMALDLPEMISPYTPAIEEQVNSGKEAFMNGTDFNAL